jgi:hypothetical protein
MKRCHVRHGLLILALFAVGLVAETKPAAAADLQDLRLQSTSTRFGRDLEFSHECTVPPGGGICATGGSLYPKPETITVLCRGRECALELQICLFYEVFSNTTGAYGGSLFFQVDGVPVFDDHANHILVYRDPSLPNTDFGNTCRHAVVPGLARGLHTVGVTAGADIFGGGTPGDDARLTIPSASLMIRVYSR